MRKARIVKRDMTYDYIDTFDVGDFPYRALNKKSLLCRGKQPKEYIYDYATFDIETTTIVNAEKPFGYMYHWQMDVAGYVITGRRWSEWVYFMSRLAEIYSINDNRRLVIYVHNLGYEFQYVRDYLEENFGGYNVFATKNRAPIRVNTPNGFEFRCSYKLTNMSLNKATLNELGVTHIKAVGDLDYKIIRTAVTPLNDAEFGYCVSDVVSLYELISMRMKNEHDNLETIPMTSTGYVRRDCRKACRKDHDYHKMFSKLIMLPHVYELLKEAGRGGNTHANRHMSGRVWSNVDSFDFVSDYPAQMLLRKYPMSKFTPYGDVESMAEFDDLLREYACLFRVTLVNVKLKDNIAMPYIPISKCWQYVRKADDSIIELRIDNGRVLSAPLLSMTITDVDYEILKRQYDWDSIAIQDMHIATYDYLPQPIRDCVMEYFKAKTDLKFAIQEEKHREDPNREKLENLTYLYAKSKNRLNGIFGMCYTDPVHQQITVNERGEWETKEPNINDALDKFHKSRNSFLYYPWGVWVTCWARLHLENLIDITGQDRTIYCDTDSSKAVGVDISSVDKFNEKIIALAEERGAYYDCNGTRFYMGIAEHENDEPIAKFKTLGAKKYVYHDKDGFHITIAGVSKAKNYDTGEYVAVEEMRCIKNFVPGFIFTRAGGNELVYNDNIGIHNITIDGCIMETASNIAMLDSTYTVGITAEYASLIDCNIYYDIEKNNT